MGVPVGGRVGNDPAVGDQLLRRASPRWFRFTAMLVADKAADARCRGFASAPAHLLQFTCATARSSAPSSRSAASRSCCRRRRARSWSARPRRPSASASTSSTARRRARGTHPRTVATRARAVFVALGVAVAPGELRDMVSQLLAEYDPLLQVAGIGRRRAACEPYDVTLRVAELAGLDREHARRATEAVLETWPCASRPARRRTSSARCDRPPGPRGRRPRGRWR